MRTLALDIGNTAVKAGCFDGSALYEMAAGLTAPQVLELVWRWKPAHVIIASVAEDAALRADELRAWVPGSILAFDPASTAVPLRNAYATPHTLGADRLAAAVGAAGLRPGRPTLIVDAGTALKHDLVTADGTYTAAVLRRAWACGCGRCIRLRVGCRCWPCRASMQRFRSWATPLREAC